MLVTPVVSQSKVLVLLDRHKYETVVDKLSDVLVVPRNHLPEIFVPKFNGDLLEYDYFI